jgi:hypothetical protein
MQGKVPKVTRSAETEPLHSARRSPTAAETFSAHQGLAASQTRPMLPLQRVTANSARTKQINSMNRMRDGGANGRGLPLNLKNGIESLSGISMDGVTVHYNSSQPVKVQAHAFAQGTDIHLGPGQEANLPHEAWHVVQQAQGRVRPTVQMKAGVMMNDESSLEAEADIMGARAMSMASMASRHHGAGLLARPQYRLSGAESMPLQARLIMAILEEDTDEYKITDYSAPFKPKTEAQATSATANIPDASGGAAAETKEISALKVKSVATEVMGYLKTAIAEQIESMGGTPNLDEDAKALEETSAAGSTNDEKQTNREGKHDPRESLADAYAIEKQFSNAEIQASVKKQLEKWIEDKAGDPSEKNPTFGRKMQFRFYTSYYDLARALLGWVQAKPGRHKEKEMAKQVFKSKALEEKINDLMKRLNARIERLKTAAESDHPIKGKRGGGAVRIEPKRIDRARVDQIIEDLSTNKHGKNRGDVGGYLKYFNENKYFDGTPMKRGEIENNLYKVIQNPEGYDLVDKMIVWHDVTEYLYGSKNHFEAHYAGRAILPEATPAEQKSTWSIGYAGERKSETTDRGLTDYEHDEKLQAAIPDSSEEGEMPWDEMRNESSPVTKFARENFLPIWSGQSYTAMRMFKMAQWAGADKDEMTALAWSIFSFWRLHYDHRAPEAYHTLHEVMDIAHNFKVEYIMRKDVDKRDTELNKFLGRIDPKGEVKGATADHQPASLESSVTIPQLGSSRSAAAVAAPAVLHSEEMKSRGQDTQVELPRPALPSTTAVAPTIGLARLAGQQPAALLPVTTTTPAAYSVLRPRMAAPRQYVPTSQSSGAQRDAPISEEELASLGFLTEDQLLEQEQLTQEIKAQILYEEEFEQKQLLAERRANSGHALSGGTQPIPAQSGGSELRSTTEGTAVKRIKVLLANPNWKGKARGSLSSVPEGVTSLLTVVSHSRGASTMVRTMMALKETAAKRLNTDSKDRHRVTSELYRLIDAIVIPMDAKGLDNLEEGCKKIESDLAFHPV